MKLEIQTPIIVVKHSKSRDLDPQHTFAVWQIPTDVQALFDKSRQCSNLIKVFEGTYIEARSECRFWLDNQHRLTTTLWIEKTSDLFVLGESD